MERKWIGANRTRFGKRNGSRNNSEPILLFQNGSINWNRNMKQINDMTFDELVPSKSEYLAKADVGEDGLILTVKGFRMETLKGDQGDEDKMVLHFQEDVKPMVLNRTNAQLIAVATGASVTGDAIGKQVVVYNDPTIAFGGKITGGLRIKKIAGAPRAAASSRNLNDAEIPF